jgi:hypothetical protein
MTMQGLGKPDGNNEPLAEGNDNNDDEHDKDGDIANDDNKYAISIESVDKPLDKGSNKYDTLRAAPKQACPESQRPSMPSP